MSYIFDSKTRTAMFCVAVACITTPAYADSLDVGAVPAAVSDALLNSTRATNAQRTLVVSNVPGGAASAIAPVNATMTTANNVRLWDEVIPPVPSPKPTQASTSNLPRTVVASAQSNLQRTSLNINATSSRLPR
ncbi:hypothetical protein [Pandoraea sp. PE-S2T-3]|uniref:hypothetical protein n=1 Tax=Pandoraea sp. PE-S2T-3 TaxID=1986993 RepID=UPI000B401B9C|nr:hypothetical protein [Pandoraea sp. PE-S2T-3]